MVSVHNEIVFQAWRSSIGIWVNYVAGGSPMIVSPTISAQVILFKDCAAATFANQFIDEIQGWHILHFSNIFPSFLNHYNDYS